MRRIWRRVVIAVGLAELLLGLGFAATFLYTSHDPLGIKIAEAVATIVVITLAGSVLPGLLLAWWGRFLPLATALIVAGPPIWFYLMSYDY